MSNHFDYLLNDESESFFQKVANEASGAPVVELHTPSFSKHASAQSEFEKVASRLDRDLGILKTAGDCGENAGMTKRANAYIDILTSNVNIDAESFGLIFDKVAAEAIQVDLSEIFDNACSQYPVAYHSIIEETLSKVAAEVVELAILEKEAVIGALAGRLLTGGRLLGRVGANIGGAKAVIGGGMKAFGRGAASAAKTTAKQAKRPFSYAGKKVGKQVKDFRAARATKISDAPKVIRGDIAKAHSKDGGKVRGLFTKGKDKALSKQLDSANARKAGLTNNQSVKPSGAPANTTAPQKTPGQVDEVAAARNAKQKTEQGQAAAGANKAAKGTGTDGPAAAPAPETGPRLVTDKSPKKTKKNKKDKKSKKDKTPPAAVEENPALMSTWKKWTEGGALTGPERGKLIRAGVTGLVIKETMFNN